MDSIISSRPSALPSFSYREYWQQFRENAYQTVVYWCTYASMAMSITLLGPAMPTLKCKCDISMAAMSWIVFCQLGLIPISTFMAVPLMQRFPPNVVHVLASSILPVCTLLLAMVTSEWFLAFIMAALGIQLGILENVTNTQMVSLHGNSMAPFLQIMYFMYGCGAFLTQIIVDPFLGHLSKNCSAQMWNEGHIPVDMATPFGLITALQIIQSVTVIILICKKGCPPLDQTKSLDSSVDVSNGPTSTAERRSSMSIFLSKINPKRPKEMLELFTPRMNLVFLAAAICFFLDGIQIEYNNYIYSFARDVAKNENISPAYVGVIFWGFFTFGRLLAAVASLRFHVSLLLTADMIGLFLGAIFVICGQSAPFMLYLGSGLFGLALSNTTPSMIALTQDFAHLTHWTTTIIIVFAAAGEALLPLIAGQIIEDHGTVKSAFPMLNLILALTVGIIFFLFLVFGKRWSLQADTCVAVNGVMYENDGSLSMKPYERLEQDFSTE